MRKSDFFELLSKYLLIMLLRFDAMMYSSFGNEHSAAGHTNFRAGRIWPTDRRFPTPGLEPL